MRCRVIAPLTRVVIVVGVEVETRPLLMRWLLGKTNLLPDGDVGVDRKGKASSSCVEVKVKSRGDGCEGGCAKKMERAFRLILEWWSGSWVYLNGCRLLQLDVRLSRIPGVVLARVCALLDLPLGFVYVKALR